MRTGDYTRWRIFAAFYGSVAFEVHQIFMLTFAELRVEGKVAQVLVVSQPPPLAFLVFLLSDWWEACATSAAVGGGTERGRLPPHPAALEVTRPGPGTTEETPRRHLYFQMRRLPGNSFYV